MYQPFFMRVCKTLCKLDCNMQQPFLLLCFRSGVYFFILYPVLQAAALHPFGKDRRYSSDFPDIVTGHNVRVQAQSDPGLTLQDEIFLLFYAAFFKEFRLRPFHGKLNALLLMIHTPHASHTAFDRIGCHSVGSKKNIILQNALIRDNIFFSGRNRFSRNKFFLLLHYGAFGYR